MPIVRVKDQRRLENLGFYKRSETHYHNINKNLIVRRVATSMNIHYWKLEHCNDVNFSSISTNDIIVIIKFLEEQENNKEAS